MVESLVDALARSAKTSPTRRTALRFLAGAAGGGLPGLLGLVRAAPGEKKRKRQRRRERQRRRGVGQALYPELRTLRPTLPPPGFEFDEIDGQHVLRFTNIVWNAGEGRLELEGSTDPSGGEDQPLFQNLYDAPVGGKRVDRRPVNGRIEYHEGHAHYHFADFASYRLLRRNGDGVYQAVGHGEKTSFCIIDSAPVAGSHPRTYRHCEQRQQGLTPGWGDVYGWQLPDQWVVLNEWPLSDGEYGLQSIADPLGLLDEGGGERERNNVATTYFTFQDGKISSVRNDP